MGSAYKAARNTYTNVLGGRREDTQADMARRLREYADWLDSRRDFDNGARYKEVFGPHFQGFNTDRTAIGRVVTFHGICKDIAGSSVDLKTHLETGELDPVLAFAELDDVPPLTLSEAEAKLRELEDLAERERRYITEAESHLELFRDKKSLNLPEIEEIVGDTKQLPPTSFFQKVLDDSDTDEDLREDSESILDMANVAFMPVRQLRWHYRSRHSALIQFSNQWMYKGELTIFPSAQEDHPDLGVELVEVPGIYKGRRNEIEARAIVAVAVHHMTHRPELSLGICTMNSDQKELILEEFERERDRNPKVQAFVEKWEEENDALEEFFIKNIETIQGDERDVMMISTLYGPEAAGAKVLQRFGPINSAHACESRAGRRFHEASGRRLDRGASPDPVHEFTLPTSCRDSLRVDDVGGSPACLTE